MGERDEEQQGPRENEPNPTQERIDELSEAESNAPVDVDWEEGGEA